MVGGEGKRTTDAALKKVQSQLHPDRPPRVIVSDSASVPRERSQFIAWWVAIIAVVILIPLLAILYPDSYRRILLFLPDGAEKTIQFTVISIGVALVIGLLSGLGRTSKNPIVNSIASLYVEVIRGIPLLVQLFWIYFALSRIVVLGPYPSAVIGLAICYGAYIGEIIRAGIQAIPKGQWEAARSLGMSAGQAMRYIVLPQAVRTVLPPIGNEFTALLKDSSLVSILAISDLLRRGREYASRTFQYFETYTMVAMVYLFMTLIFSRVVSYIEQGMSIETKAEGPPRFMHRLAAYVTDGLVVYVLWLIATSLVGVWVDPGATPLAGISLSAWLFLAILVPYLVIPWATSGRTPGKTAVGLRIVDANHKQPGWERALLRIVPVLITIVPIVVWGSLWGVPLGAEQIGWEAIPWMSYLLWILPVIGFVGYLICQWDCSGQGWHDKLAGTYVVRST